MLKPVLKFAALLPGLAMVLGGAYGTFNFLPKVLNNTADPLSQMVLLTSIVAVFWGFFQLWTMYNAFHRPHQDEGD